MIAHIGAKSYAGILVLRFLLGMAEAGVSPCSKLLITAHFLINMHIKLTDQK